jgi:hypothetical protein
MGLSTRTRRGDGIAVVDQLGNLKLHAPGAHRLALREGGNGLGHLLARSHAHALHLGPRHWRERQREPRAQKRAAV